MRRWGPGSMMVVALCVLGACDDDPTPSRPASPGDDVGDDAGNNGTDDVGCTPGALGCTCDGGVCSGDGVVCDRGYCVEGMCERGQQGCACLADGTCDALDGRPMTCSMNVCTPTVGPADGELGGACFANATCLGELVCVAGVCEEAGCPSGATGCPCGPMGRCDEAEARCNAETVCERAGCVAGADGCACGPGGQCDGALQCVEAVCRVPNRVQVVIGEASVRGCDVLMRQPDRRVASVRYAVSARGQHRVRGDRVAFAFVARQDEALAGPVLDIVFEGEDVASPDLLTPIQITCVDREGAPIDRPMITLR